MLHLFPSYKITLKADKHSFFPISLSLLVSIQYTIERMVLPLSFWTFSFIATNDTMSRWSSFSTHSCNLLLSGSAPSMNNWWWPRQGFPSRTRRNRSSSHGSAFPPRISEGCSDSWPKRAPATDDLWVRKNNDRSNEGSSRWIGYWLDSRFRTVWSRLCRPLSSTRLSLLGGNPCNVSRWTRFLKVETYYYIINCYVTLFLKVFLQYFINCGVF